MKTLPVKEEFLKKIQHHHYDKLHNQFLEALETTDNPREAEKKIENFYSLAVQRFFGDFVVLNYQFLCDNCSKKELIPEEVAKNQRSVMDTMALFLEERMTHQLQYALREEKFKLIYHYSLKILNCRGSFEALPSSQQKVQVKKLASAIASLHTQKEYCEKKLFSRLIKKLNITSYQSLFQKTCRSRWNSFYEASAAHQSPSSQNAFNNIIRTARNYLPGPNELSDPSADEIERFIFFLSYLFTPSFLYPKLREDYFFTLLPALVEYNARSLSSAVQTNDSSKRFYFQLGLKARKVVNQSFKKISRLQRLKGFQKFCTQIKPDDPHFSQTLEVVGMFRNEKSSVYLNKLLPKLNQEKARIALLGLSRIPTEENASRLYKTTKKLCSSRKKLEKNQKRAQEFLITYFRIIALSQFPGNLRMNCFYRGWELAQNFDTRNKFEITLLVFRQFADFLPGADQGNMLLDLLQGLNLQVKQAVSAQQIQKEVKNIKKVLAQNKKQVINLLAQDSGKINIPPSEGLLLLLEFITRHSDPALVPFCERTLHLTRDFFSRTLSPYQIPHSFHPEKGEKIPLSQVTVLEHLAEAVEACDGIDSPLFKQIVSSLKRARKKTPSSAKKETETEAKEEEEKEVTSQSDDNKRPSEVTDLEKKRQAFMERRKQRLAKEKRKPYG